MADGKIKVEEALNNIDGFEEIAIDKAFDVDPYELLESGRHIRLFRVLAFLEYKRGNLTGKRENDMVAKQNAMSLKLSELTEMFDTEDAEETAVEPSDTDAPENPFAQADPNAGEAPAPADED